MTTSVFLGAGASKAFGYPLTTELLPRILQQIDAGTLFEGVNPGDHNDRDRAWFRLGLTRFFPGLESVRQDHRSVAAPLGIGVTDLLTLVDRALQVGESRAGMSPEQLSRFRHLLERAIYEVLLHNNDRRKKPNVATLDRFFAWLRTLPSPVGIMTTNYDTAVDQRLYDHVGRTDKRKWEARIGSTGRGRKGSEAERGRGVTC